MAANRTGSLTQCVSSIEVTPPRVCLQDTEEASDVYIKHLTYIYGQYVCIVNRAGPLNYWSIDVCL